MGPCRLHRFPNGEYQAALTLKNMIYLLSCEKVFVWLVGFCWHLFVLNKGIFVSTYPLVPKVLVVLPILNRISQETE